MKVFFLVFFLTLILSFVLPAKTDKQWRVKLFWTLLPLCLFGALRVNFGNDYPAYEAIYYEHHDQVSFSFDETAHSEIGFQFLCYIIPTFRLLLIFNAVLLCLALGVFIYNNVPRQYLWLAILLIFLNPEKNIYGSLVGMRNGFAVITFLFSFIFIQQRKLIPFLGMLLLAMSMHTSAVFFMPLAYIIGRNGPFSRKEVTWWIIAGLFILMSSLSGLMEMLTPFLTEYFDRYEHYYENFDEGHRGFLLTTTGIILFVLVFSLTLYNNNTRNKLKRQNTLVHQGISLSINNTKNKLKRQNSLMRLGLLYVFTTLMGSLSSRASYFYDMFFIGTVVTLFANNKRTRVSAWVLVLISIAMSFYSLRLWMTNQYVRGNPLYMIYTSIIGSW